MRVDEMKRKEGIYNSMTRIGAVMFVLVISLYILFSLPMQTFAKENLTETTSSSFINENSASVETTQEKEKKTAESAESKIKQANDEKSKQSKAETEETSKSKNELEPEPATGEEHPTEKQIPPHPTISTMEASKVVWEGVASKLGNVYYQLWSDGRAGIKNGDKIAENAYIKIPDVISYDGNNYDVVHIYEGAFKDNLKLKNVEFTGEVTGASNLELIAKEAFMGCVNLEKVYLGKCGELRTIDAHAFNGCTKLNYISFANCEKLEVIGEKSFLNCKALPGLDFGNISKLRSIGVRAFENCLSLGGKSVTIPNSVINIWDHAFYSYSGTDYKQLFHKTVAHLTGSLPNLDVESVPLPEESKQYESFVDSSKDKTTLHKAAKWIDEKRTKAEIRIDYGFEFDRTANLDVVFVLDQSGSMFNSADAKDKNGVMHKYPRLFLMDDIVHGASQMLLDNKEGTGYNNRVSLVSFGKSSTPIYKSDFMTKSADVKTYLENHPMNHEEAGTNYNSGLQGAIDVTKNHDPNRKPVVIFLSDGIYTDDLSGVTQAEVLRKQKIPVYPIAMYYEGSIEKLKPISHDKKTAYVAKNTDSFKKIMMDVLEDVVNQAHTLSVELEDVIAKEFELESDSDVDFTLSENGGKVSHEGNKVVWDLNGCAQGAIHTLKMQVKLKPGTEYQTSGILPTNDSLKISDGSVIVKDQPQLDRYLAHFEFKNETFPNQELPEEIRKLLPPSRGGFADNTLVKADEITKKVRTKEGQWWEFLGWDKAEATIAGKDVLFSGKWRYVGYDFSFIKQNEDGEGLSGAEFSLYAWKGGSVAPGEKELVTEESLAAGKWQLISTQSSQLNGRVDFLEVPVQAGKYFQLVEYKAPEHYRKPQGQWRFSFSAEDGFIENDQIVSIPSQDNEQPPKFEKIQEGEHQGMWCVLNKHAHGELPATGGRGTASFAIGAFACGSIGISGLGVFYLYDRKRRHYLIGRQAG